MKVTVNLRSPIWSRQERRAILDKVVQESGVELEEKIKQKILGGQKTGKLYRKGPILKKATKALLALGLSKSKGKTDRVVAGSRIHRASAPGQSPASDTGGLVNSIRAAKTGEMKSTVASGKGYAAALDDGTNIAGRKRNVTIAPRPFFKSTAEEYKPQFKENVEKAIAEITQG